MSDLVLSHRQMFDTEEEATAAFYRKELPWLHGDKAYTWKFRAASQRVIGHTAVVVDGVAGISAEGAPIYQCRTPSGQLLQIEADILMTKQQMLYNPDGSPSPYHEWFLADQAEKTRRKSRPGSGTVPVTVGMTF